jgi:hypothetical protein
MPADTIHAAELESRSQGWRSSVRQRASSGSPGKGEPDVAIFSLVGEGGQGLVSVVLEIRQVLAGQVTQDHAVREAAARVDDPRPDPASQPAEVVEADAIEDVGRTVGPKSHFRPPAEEKLPEPPGRVGVDAQHVPVVEASLRVPVLDGGVPATPS